MVKVAEAPLLPRGALVLLPRDVVFKIAVPSSAAGVPSACPGQGQAVLARRCCWGDKCRPGQKAYHFLQLGCSCPRSEGGWPSWKSGHLPPVPLRWVETEGSGKTKVFCERTARGDVGGWRGALEIAVLAQMHFQARLRSSGCGSCVRITAMDGWAEPGLHVQGKI